ncbi:MAG TPA: DUF1257 domain-containing protein [Polyangia bacterium]|nr:DUF1257 domain-containing protein [Polyangia bacterium]
MSHFTKVATKINNLVALKRALEKLGWKYAAAEQGVEVRGYKGQKITAELSIDMGKYDVGVVRAADGNYTLVADWWGIETTRGKTEQEVVEELNKEYAYQRVVQACEEQGYQIQPEDIQQLEDGTVRLVASKWG